MTGPFGSEARHYYNVGMSVIPLIKNEKVPAVPAWQLYHDKLVESEIMDGWIRDKGHGNIGLVLGEQSDVVIIDIDTKDEGLVKAIEEMLPKSPWRRVGAKGCALAYKWAGVGSFRIRDANGAMIVEHLSSRTQLVLPPSIHPKTMRGYVATGDLYNMVKNGKLPVLDRTIQAQLRGVIEDYGVVLAAGGSGSGSGGGGDIMKYVSHGSRDVSMTRYAGMLASAVVMGHMNLKRALDDMIAWHGSRLERVAGDDVGLDKSLLKVCEFIKKDIFLKKKVLPLGWDEGLGESEAERLGMGKDVFADVNREWSGEAIMKYVSDGLVKCGEDQVRLSELMTEVLGRLARSPNLGEVLKDMILQQMNSSIRSGLRPGVPALRRQLKACVNGGLEGKNHTEIALGVIAELGKFGELRFWAGGLWQWGGSHWEEVEDHAVLRVIAEEFGGLDAARKAGDHMGILKIVGTLVAGDLGGCDGVNFANGVLMSDGSLVDHDRKHGFTYTLGYRYRAEAARECPKFMAFLGGCFGNDSESYMCLQELVCSTLFGFGPRYQRCALLYGLSDTGKSQLLTVIRNLLPVEAQCAVGPEMWGDKFGCYPLVGKLLNVAGELSEDKNIPGKALKEVSDGTPITVQKKGGQLFMYEPKCMHWFASNHLPQTRDTSSGFNNRWTILSFENVVSRNNVIINLGLKIVEEEMEGIVAWAVEGLNRLVSNRGYTITDGHRRCIEQMANANNSVRYFFTMSEKVGKKPGNLTCEGDLYTEYYTFCKMSQCAKPVSRRIFSVRMADLGVKTKMTENPKTLWYIGITLANGKKG